ncbi:MAG: hypothetical protein JSS57_16310 [Proteobacteria bacterium]|nr:hypothetical protein [Pseudomonadota bacterium]
MLNDLARTRGYTLQIELTTQSFRLSGDEAALAERDEAIAAREACLARLPRIPARNILFPSPSIAAFRPALPMRGCRVRPATC